MPVPFFSRLPKTAEQKVGTTAGRLGPRAETASGGRARRQPPYHSSGSLVPSAGRWGSRKR